MSATGERVGDAREINADLLAACEAAFQEIGAWHDDMDSIDPMELPEAAVYQQLKKAIAKAKSLGSTTDTKARFAHAGTKTGNT